MRSLTFDELFAMLLAVQLSPGDLARLREWIGSIAHPAECIALIEQAAAGRPCPHCGCARKHRCGQASGLQRFRCLHCGRSHNALTGTPLARLRKKERWLPYLQCVLESRTVRDAAQVVGVHRTTSFRWRHRFVPGAMRDRPKTLSAVVVGGYRINANTALFFRDYLNRSKKALDSCAEKLGYQWPPVSVPHHITGLPLSQPWYSTQPLLPTGTVLALQLLRFKKTSRASIPAA
jgi:transposase-like protein